MNTILFNNIRYADKHACLDLIRGLAVLLVVFSHLDNYGAFYLWPISAQPIQGFIGQLGVNLFFVLSGYLIWTSASNLLPKQNGLKIYFINRFSRIYPLYLVCIATVLVLSSFYIGYFKPNVSLESVLRHLFFTQNFEPYVTKDINRVFWSLTHEVLFYFLVPALVYLRPKFLAIVLSVIISQYLWIYHEAIFHAFFKYWALFATGILVAITNKTLSRLFAIWLLLIALAFAFSIKNHLGLFLFSAASFCLLLNFNFSGKLSKPFIFIGLISYSLYIWHTVILHLVMPYIKLNFFLIPPVKPFLPAGFSLSGLLIIVLILLVSYISYKFIEKPSMTYLRLYASGASGELKNA